MKKITLPLILFISTILFGQEGTNVYPFLNIPISARQAALGGDAISVRDYDVSFVGANPGLMNLEQDEMISINYHIVTLNTDRSLIIPVICTQ